ncbi:carboxypeptidase B-like [Amyelois transitella]|uniref:carboxypeptidase B-like n=1 Tax=Amyelois transitella TaxID=680683 RepID=UPI0029907B87|nr:carboxypeptidase B-like [Amyelois transitella]
MDVMVACQRLTLLEKLLRERDIQFVVTATDAGSVSPSRAKSPTFVMPTKGSVERCMDWNDYYPLNIIYNFLDSLEIAYPSICTVTSIGNSVEGREIKMLKISNSDAKNTGVWLDGAIHAREWISTSVVTYIADYLATNFNELPASITNKDWYLVPIVNPDGYHHTHNLERMWRKNRARTGSTVTGVDLNRNFGYYWGRGTTSEASSNDPNHLNYRGPEPFSEPETCAVKDLLLYSGTPFKIFLTFHSCSEVISFPWCYTADPCPDYVSLLEGGTIMAKAIYDTTGRMYKVGNFKDLMYYACGTSIDWSYGTAHIPFSYLVELRSKEYRFTLPKNEITDCCKEALNAVIALAEYVDKKKCLNCTVFAKKNR